MLTPMSEGIEVVGAGVSDALLARAVEPQQGEASDDGHGATRCLNCGAFLNGPYCNRCGQKAHLHRSISDFGHDLLHGVLHFDGKLWRTLPLLIWRPGELTRRYIHGERARFVSPLALFLFAVFVTFAVFQFGGHSEERRDAIKTVAETSDVEKDMRAQIAALDRRIADARARAQDVSALEKERTDLQTGLDVVETASAWGMVATDKVMGERTGARQASAAQEGAIQASEMQAADESHVTVEGNEAAIKAVRGFIGKLKKNPDLLFYKMQSYAYKYAWAMIPFSAVWLWLLYAFDRRYLYYDHIVFVTYSIAFMMLLGTTLILLTRMGLSEDIAVPVFFLYAPYHIYRQLRGAYRGGRLVSFIRTVAVLLGAILILLAFGSLLVALGIG